MAIIGNIPYFQTNPNSSSALKISCQGILGSLHVIMINCHPACPAKLLSQGPGAETAGGRASGFRGSHDVWNGWKGPGLGIYKLLDSTRNQWAEKTWFKQNDTFLEGLGTSKYTISVSFPSGNRFWHVFWPQRVRTNGPFRASAEKASFYQQFVSRAWGQQVCEVFVWWVFIKFLIPHEDHHPRWDETNTSSQLYCELSWLQLPHFSAGSDASSLAILTCSPWWRARNLETWNSKEPWCFFFPCLGPWNLATNQHKPDWQLNGTEWIVLVNWFPRPGWHKPETWFQVSWGYWSDNLLSWYCIFAMNIHRTLLVKVGYPNT